MTRRIALKLGLLFLAGAIINVAVAWSLAIWSTPAPPYNPSGNWRTLQHDVELNLSQRYGLFREASGAQLKFRQRPLLAAIGIQLQQLHWVSQKYDERGVLVYWVNDRWIDSIDAPEFASQDYDLLWYSAGLPLPSMQGGQWTTQDHPFVDPSPTSWLHRGFWVGDKRPQSEPDLPNCRFVPLCPAWPGFAINTLFYCLLLWLLFFATFRFRRWRRLKRGLCAACGYPVGLSEICTECGKQVTPRNVATM